MTAALRLPERAQRFVYPLSVLLLAVLCYLAGATGLWLSPAESRVAPIWPVTGIAFAAIYLFGYRLWPGPFLGLIAAFMHGFEHTAASDIYLLIVGPAATLTGQVLFGVWLLRRISRGRGFLDSPPMVFRFLAVVVLTAAMGATVLNLLLHLHQAIPPEEAFQCWVTYWLAGIASTTLISPAIVSFRKRYTTDWTRPLLAEASAAFLVLYVVAHILFGIWPLGVFAEPVPLPIILALLWVAIRFGVRETALALLMVAAIAVHGALIGAGPYPAASTIEALLLTLIFLIVVAAGFYTLAAALIEGQRSARALRNVNVTLEQRVSRRTDALAQANTELTRYRDRLEDLVAERTADLELANREIESFSYSVSHDLRSPLRAIDGYSHALIEDYGDKLDTKALEYLKRSRAASQRMGVLIDDVLLLSRVTRHELELHRVDMTALGRSVIKEIESADSSRKVSFVVQDRMFVEGDEHLLRIVLENLLGNAWKYSARKEHARIELGMRKTRDERVFFVRDNGIGFDMHYKDQLFGAFQRLHDPDEFEGTGIGLATVARVMTRHGGRVWAKGKVNVGATFYFAFPHRNLRRITGPRKALEDELDEA